MVLTGVRNLRLFDLPQELLDIVYDLAYPEEEGLKLINISEWGRRQKILRQQDPARRTQSFPKSKACAFLVCKAYFKPAITIWIGNQWIDSQLQETPIYGAPKNMIDLRKYTKKLVCSDLPQTRMVAHFPAVKSLRLGLSTYDLSFDGSGFETPWSRQYDDQNIKQVKAYKTVIELRGLRSFEIFSTSRFQFLSDHENAVLKSNMKKLEDTARSYVTSSEEEVFEDEWEEHVRTSAMDERVVASHAADWRSMSRVVEGELMNRIILNEEISAPLKTSEIPDGDRAIIKMLIKDPKNFLNWVREMKAKEQEGATKDDGHVNREGGIDEERPNKRQRMA
ncbi:hypothetical protein PRZ48_008537 [Zasmidium cellare]|uniref:F-box domain-containing protein n=1 Tax=Zasmidium cellare TaxID=395010 RepID=A0ABR0EGZ4_ZASCE|nr:hypothetical protein PRZ48_008537 [Zasmidium cellare]